MSQVAFKGLQQIATAAGVAGGSAILGTGAVAGAGAGGAAAGVLATASSIGTTATALLATPLAPVVIGGAVIVGVAALYDKYSKKKKA